jgi:hypothetical protein
MGTFRLRLTLIGFIGAAPMIAAGCGGTAAPAAPSPTTNVSQDPAELPLPTSEAGLAYVQAVLKDKTRLIEVFNDQGLDGALDSSGRSKLIKAVPIWWKEVEVVSRYPKPPEQPFRVTPDMGIRIYPPGSLAAAAQRDGLPNSKPDLQIMVFRARQLSRVLITDVTPGPLDQAVFVIPSTEPMDWLYRLFAGKL